MVGHGMRSMEGLAVHSLMQLGGAFREEPPAGCSYFAPFGADSAPGLGPVGAMPNHFVFGCRCPGQEHLFPPGKGPRKTGGSWGFDKLFALFFEKDLSYLGEPLVDLGGLAHDLQYCGGNIGGKLSTAGPKSCLDVRTIVEEGLPSRSKAFFDISRSGMPFNFDHPDGAWPRG